MNLTPDNILNIIKGCSGLVKSLKITGRSIEVEFVVPHQPTNDTPTTHNLGQTEFAPIPQKEIPEEKNILKNLSEGIPQEELEEAELLDDLKISNPSAMEDLIAMKEVVSEKEENR